MRARNIKPGFFENEELAEMPFECRLLYIGLWCYADREGRFEWRPKRIKALIFPYDNIDINKLLDVITCKGHVMTYNYNENTYGFIPTFSKHNKPHPHEAKSQCPPPPNNIKQQLKNDVMTCHDMSLNVTKCNADIMNEDIMNEDIREDVITCHDMSRQKKINYKWFMIFWNTKINSSLNHIKELTDERRRKIKTRFTKKQNFNELFEQAVLKIPTVPFLNGDNNRKWCIDFDWLIANDTNIIKVLEGKYDEKKIETRRNKETKRIEQELIEKYGDKKIAN